MPYLRSFATAVPQNPEVRHEILKAAQALADENDPVRQRRIEIASIRKELEAIREEAIGLCRDARSRIFSELRKYGYNPDEPRVPKHQDGAGEWTRVAGNDNADSASDLPSIPFQEHGKGHHWVPRQIFENRDFPQETKDYFENFTSGPLADRSVNYNRKEHIDYNKAVDELLKAYKEQRNITDKQMMLPEAREFGFMVYESTDARIHPFVEKIRWERFRYVLRYGLWRRFGGGDEE